MSLVLLESGVAILTFLAGAEMRRQRMPWRAVLVRSLILFMGLTLAILLWRGV
jgi:hypothetical protein